MKERCRRGKGLRSWILWASFRGILLVSIVLSACQVATAPKTPTDFRTEFHLSALPAHPAYPVTNQPNSNRMLLGWNLFYDPILSGGKDVACGSCHHAYYGMGDGLALSIGVGGKGIRPDRLRSTTLPAPTPRNAQTIINVGYTVDESGGAPMFWDGRVQTLEAQALEPIKSQVEMRGTHFDEAFAIDLIIARLRRITRYEAKFAQAFPLELDSVRNGSLPDVITANTLAKAIANFERELVSPNSRYDKYVRGTDTALTSIEKDGLEVFANKARCINCLSGPTFSDFTYHVTG